MLINDLEMSKRLPFSILIELSFTSALASHCQAL